jgi:hypothetical protein
MSKYKCEFLLNESDNESTIQKYDLSVSKFNLNTAIEHDMSDVYITSMYIGCHKLYELEISTEVVDLIVSNYKKEIDFNSSDGKIIYDNFINLISVIKSKIEINNDLHYIDLNNMFFPNENLDNVVNCGSTKVVHYLLIFAITFAISPSNSEFIKYDW